MPVCSSYCFSFCNNLRIFDQIVGVPVTRHQFLDQWILSCGELTNHATDSRSLPYAVDVGPKMLSGPHSTTPKARVNYYKSRKKQIVDAWPGGVLATSATGWIIASPCQIVDRDANWPKFRKSQALNAREGMQAMFTKSKMTYEAIPLPDRFNFDAQRERQEAKAFHDRMSRRHTVRDFSDRPVPRDLIETCLATAGTAPSGANHQPWFFACVSDPAMKARIRKASEDEERRFYEGGAGDEWIKALEPIGTDASKPHLTTAPWLIVVFAQRWGTFEEGGRYKNYYVPESVGIATGFLIAALHHAGLATLTHTPARMKFLNDMLGRPASEKATMVLTVGHAATDATVPKAAKIKKGLSEISGFW